MHFYNIRNKTGTQAINFYKKTQLDKTFYDETLKILLIFKQFQQLRKSAYPLNKP